MTSDTCVSLKGHANPARRHSGPHPGRVRRPHQSGPAHGDRDRLDQKRSEYDARLNAPVAMSPSVSLVDSNPGSAGISGCFMKTAPLSVMSGLDSVAVQT